MKPNISAKFADKWIVKFLKYKLTRSKIAKAYPFLFWQISQKNPLSDFEELPLNQFWKYFKYFYICLKDISLSFPQRLKKVKKVYPWPINGQKTDPRSNHDLAPQKGWLKAIGLHFLTFYWISEFFRYLFVFAIPDIFWFWQLFDNQSPPNKKIVVFYKK